MRIFRLSEPMLLSSPRFAARTNNHFSDQFLNKNKNEKKETKLVESGLSLKRNSFTQVPDNGIGRPHTLY
jgi:hypothetical protein